MMAIDMKGDMIYELHEGSINGNRFQNFIHLLPKMPKGSALIMDNIGFHKSQKVRNLARSRGLTLPWKTPSCAFVHTPGNTRERLRLIRRSNTAALSVVAV